MSIDSRELIFVAIAAIIIVLLSVLSKGSRGPRETKAPDIDPNNPTNQSKDPPVHRKVKRWIWESPWLVGLGALLVLGALAAPFVPRVTLPYAHVGNTLALAIQAAVALLAVGALVWIFWDRTTAIKTVAAVVAIAVLAFVWVLAGKPLYHPSRPSMDMSSNEAVPLKGSLHMSANGDTKHLPLTAGQVASITGSGFTTYVRFTNGSECGFGKDPTNPTCYGPKLEEWAHDETGADNNVTYVMNHP